MFKKEPVVSVLILWAIVVCAILGIRQQYSEKFESGIECSMQELAEMDDNYLINQELLSRSYLAVCLTLNIEENQTLSQKQVK